MPKLPDLVVSAIANQAFPALEAWLDRHRDRAEPARKLFLYGAEHGHLELVTRWFDLATSKSAITARTGASRAHQKGHPEVVEAILDRVTMLPEREAMIRMTARLGCGWNLVDTWSNAEPWSLGWIDVRLYGLQAIFREAPDHAVPAAQLLAQDRSSKYFLERLATACLEASQWPALLAVVTLPHFPWPAPVKMEGDDSTFLNKVDARVSDMPVAVVTELIQVAPVQHMPALAHLHQAHLRAAQLQARAAPASSASSRRRRT